MPTPADLFPGYEIVAEISRGGQGIVYQAVQQTTKRKVAIKVLLHGQFADKASRRRFQREIEMLAQLRHPNIVSIYHAELTKDGRQFYVMDYVRGRRLDEHVQNQCASVEQIIKLYIGICEAMHYAHEHGIVHRDLKPQNILVDNDGNAHILDFGLARPLAVGSDPQLSASVHVMGTLRYLSPEQAGRDPNMIDRRTDIYALGVILYTLLTGSGPYDTDSDLHSALHNILHTAPRRPSSIREGLQGDVETILLTCLAKERERRYPSAAALAADLRAFLAGAPISAKQDSLAYLVRMHTKRAVARHRVTTHLAVIAAATTLAFMIGEPLFFSWTRTGQILDRQLTRPLRNQPIAAPTGPVLQQVRVIALTDASDVEALAKRESLADVTTANRPSWRRLHGRLMERLAQAGVRAVAWDLTFEGETPFDADFARGARALREAGAEVVVNVTVWPMKELPSSRLSRTIAQHVRWGWPGLWTPSSWALLLFMQRGLADPLPSLALTTLTAARQPDANPDFHVDDGSESLEILYWTSDPDVPRLKVWEDSSDHVKLSYLRDVPDDTPAMGLKAGDRVGYFVLPMPHDDVLAASTINYDTVFSAAIDDLKNMLRDKVVVIGDIQGTTDRYPHPDGRTLPGCYAHAVGIDMLLQSISIDRPRGTARVALTLGGGLVGCLIVTLASRRRWRAYLLVAAAAAAGFGASLVMARLANMVWNPLLPILAMVIAGEMSLWIGRRNKLGSQTV